jgi:hypothetical protein
MQIFNEGRKQNFRVSFTDICEPNNSNYMGLTESAASTVVSGLEALVN